MTKRNYNATFILDTRNYKEPVETLIEKISTTIGSINGEVKKVKNLGQKDFSRVVDRKFPNGIYVDFQVEAEPAFMTTIQEKFRLDRNVNRILVTAA